MRTIRHILMGCALLAMPWQANAASPFMLGNAPGSHDLTAFTKWTSLLPRYEAQRSKLMGACRGKAECLPQAWETLLKAQKGKTRFAQLDAVNRFFNAIPYVEDQDNFGEDDRWQTPYEMMKEGGDCEDYAIAKYISLKRLGVPEKDMRIMIVQDQNLGGIIHAVLEVKLEGEAYILDNQAEHVAKASDIYHYTPIYAINAQLWWAFV